MEQPELVMKFLTVLGGTSDFQETDPNPLRALTSLNKEVRPLFLGDNSIWSFPSVSSLSDYSISRP